MQAGVYEKDVITDKELKDLRCKIFKIRWGFWFLKDRTLFLCHYSFIILHAYMWKSMEERNNNVKEGVKALWLNWQLSSKSTYYLKDPENVA